jgi:hypothetical protein
MKRWLFTVTASVLMLLPAMSAMAAGGGGAPIVFVSDTRKLTGIMYWWGCLYNESHMQFTILTCVLIPVAGVFFGWVADIVMGWIGIDLTKRKVAEH